MKLRDRLSGWPTTRYWFMELLLRLRGNWMGVASLKEPLTETPRHETEGGK